MNCRTHEHRHFERILRKRACLVSISGSGSVKTSLGPCASVSPRSRRTPHRAVVSASRRTRGLRVYRAEFCDDSTLGPNPSGSACPLAARVGRPRFLYRTKMEKQTGMRNFHSIPACSRSLPFVPVRFRQKNFSFSFVSPFRYRSFPFVPVSVGTRWGSRSPTEREQTVTNRQ